MLFFMKIRVFIHMMYFILCGGGNSRHRHTRAKTRTLRHKYGNHGASQYLPSKGEPKLPRLVANVGYGDARSSLTGPQPLLSHWNCLL
jgi:hypothetical protein